MNMQKTKDHKLHIGIFGKRNQGKSSVMNLLTGQETSIVSAQAGTTTDPVKKSIEILGLGSVILTDTAGIDDEGSLGQARVNKTLEILNQIDIAIVLISDNTWGQAEKDICSVFLKNKIPFLILHNKSDKSPLLSTFKLAVEAETHTQCIEFSALNISAEAKDKLFAEIKQLAHKTQTQTLNILEGIVDEKEVVLLITPIDSQAPQGRLILPQVQLIRQCLDKHAICLVCQEDEIEKCLEVLKHKPALAITDSQIFGKVHTLIPKDIPLTSFSICLARQKGNFDVYLKGAPVLSSLKEGDKVLILESCTHQVNCEDIGRVKIPAWIRKFTNKNIEFDIVSGLNPLPEDIESYALVIQCGACMVTQRQLQNRLNRIIDAKIPLTNYGIAIAYLNGIFDRATEIFRKNSKDE